MAEKSGVETPYGYSRTIHGLAVTLTIAVFPLIWMGGLVTTYDAGMAVPDWPGTYGWNMFSYPISTWLYGPFDLLVEHSHRLLGALAGFISIGLVVAAMLKEPRRWFRVWTVGILLAVIAQGALGGARVVLDQRTFAMIHGCTGPLFFALAAATAVMCSRWWLNYGQVSESSQQIRCGRWTVGLAVAVLLASYCQLVIGAQLRHVTAAISHRQFMSFVHLHLTMAAIVMLLVVVLTGVTSISSKIPGQVRRPAQILFLLVLVQIALGIATWIVNYALPWADVNATLASYTILAKGYWESLIITTHVATGSLIIAMATVAMLRAWRIKMVTEGVPTGKGSKVN